MQQISKHRRRGGVDFTTLIFVVLILALPLLVAYGLFARRLAPATPLAGAPNPQNQQTNTSAPVAANPGFIAWDNSLEGALQQAKAARKPVMIDFYTDWCPACHWMDEKIYTWSPVIAESQNFVCVRLNAEQQTQAATHYNINSYPTIVWTDFNGNEISRASSTEGDQFPQLMQAARSRFAP